MMKKKCKGLVIGAAIALVACAAYINGKRAKKDEKNVEGLHEKEEIVEEVMEADANE